MKPGDLVKLRSGSPAMVVVALSEEGDGRGGATARCVYYSGEGLDESDIELVALVAAEVPPESEAYLRECARSNRAIETIDGLRMIVRLNDPEKPATRFNLLKILDDAYREIAR